MPSAQQRRTSVHILRRRRSLHGVLAGQTLRCRWATQQGLLHTTHGPNTALLLAALYLVQHDCASMQWQQLLDDLVLKAEHFKACITTQHLRHGRLCLIRTPVQMHSSLSALLSMV